MPEYKIGDIVKCKVSGEEDYGAFVTLENGYSGLIHISEISQYFVKNISDYLQLNDLIYAKIIDINEQDKKLKLSIKNIDYKHTGEELKGNGFEILKENLPKWMEEYHQMVNEKKDF